MRTSLTQRGQSESVSRGQPSGGNVRSRRLSSGAGAHFGCGEGRSNRVLYARTKRPEGVGRESQGLAHAQSLAGKLDLEALMWDDGLRPERGPAGGAFDSTNLLDSDLRPRPASVGRPLAPPRGPRGRREGRSRGRVRVGGARPGRELARGHRRDRPSGRRRAARLRRQHRLRRAERDAHLRRPTSAQLQQNLVRSHSTGVGPDLAVAAGARHDAAARAGPRARLQRRAPGARRRARRDAQRGRAPARPGAGIGRRVGRPGAARAPGARDDRGRGGARSREGPFVARAPRRWLRAGVAPVVLEAKEGLSLINGTQYMASAGALALLDAERLCVVADVAGAMSLEALKGSSRPFDERLQAARPHPGPGRRGAQPARAARRERDHGEPPGLRQGAGRVQPALHAPGARRVARRARVGARGARARGRTRSPTTRASSSTTTAGADIISGGNFHGQPLALALDLAAMAAAELANISERRVEQLVNPALSTGLTPFLAPGQRAALGLHDRAGRERVARQREQGPLPSRERRLDPVERRPGRPREHGEHLARASSSRSSRTSATPWRSRS